MSEPLKVLYVVMTCDAYRNTRCEWAMNTWLRQVRDVVFLGSHMDSARTMVGWDTGDAYDACPLKVMNFCRNFDASAYDWVVLVDDDTFLFPKRLETYLSSLDPTKPLYVGTPWDAFGVHYMSGGAGCCLSRDLFRRLQEYTRSQPDSALHISLYSDVCLGQWCTQLKAIYVESSRFCGTYTLEGAETCLSRHYVKEDGFYALAAFLEP